MGSSVNDEEDKAKGTEAEKSPSVVEEAVIMHRLDAHEAYLLNVRKRIAKIKPKFRREESWRYAKLGQSWRRPKGGTSKIRLGIKGWPALVKIGYRGSRSVRGLDPRGFREILIHTEDELQRLDPKRESVRIAHTVGARRRLSIIEKARSLQLKVLNPGKGEMASVPSPSKEEASR